MQRACKSGDAEPLWDGLAGFVPAAFSALLSTRWFFGFFFFFFTQALLPKGIPHTITSLFPGFLPASSLAALQIYLCYKKQTEHIAVELLEQIL